MTNEALRSDTDRVLSAQDLLAGSALVHEVEVPQAILEPGQPIAANASSGTVRLKPLSVATLTLISRAARDDVSLVPILMIKESLVEPELTLDQIRQMHVGLVEFLVNKVNAISGIESGEGASDALNAPLGRTHVLLAKHFGWTPQQVSQLTPGQVAVYLAGIEKLIELEGHHNDA